MKTPQGCLRLVAVQPALGVVRYDAGAVFAVRCEQPVEAGKVQSGTWNQGRESRHKVKRFQHDMSGTIAQPSVSAANLPVTAELCFAFRTAGGNPCQPGVVVSAEMSAGGIVWCAARR